ncbi:THAP domain-containing protein 5-like [Cloeon dipterum]|uniref:THAP domain-containing protein 5-like n=1 Tax=Cloeon dipterum TaxID=197152 RepID=UPI00321F9185
MVISCSVPTCRNRFVKGGQIQFHSFPMKREEMCRIWADAIGRQDWFPTKNSFVCSGHFKPEDYQTKPGKLKHFLKEGVVPSVFGQSQPRRSNNVSNCDSGLLMKVPFNSAQQFQQCDVPSLSEIISSNLTVTRSPQTLEALLPGGVSIVPVKRKSLKRESPSPSQYEEPPKIAKLSLPNALNGSVVITASPSSKQVPKLRPIMSMNNDHSSNDECEEPLDVSQFLSISMQPEEDKVKRESVTSPALSSYLSIGYEDEKSKNNRYRAGGVDAFATRSSVGSNGSLTHTNGSSNTNAKLDELQRRNAQMHAELKKRDSVIKDLRMRLSNMNNNVDSTVIEFLRRHFDNTAFQILDNHIRNKKANSFTFECYTETIMNFAANLYKSSPKAYLLVRQHFDLPPPTYLHKRNLVPELNGEQGELSSCSNEYSEEDIYQETAVPEHLPEKNDLPPQSISDKNIKEFRQFNIIIEHDD